MNPYESGENGKAAQIEAKQESNSWETAAINCWAPNCQKDSAADGTYKLAASGSSGPDWLEERAKHRVEELAKEYGLDPSKATADDVIKARAEQGNKLNEGRVERLRRAEALKYGLDPDKADWEKIDIARVEARKKELGMN